MNSSRTPICTTHRLARLIAWTRLVLAWVAMLMFSAAPKINARRLGRFANLSLDSLARRVRNLIIIRAAQLMNPRRRAKQRFNFAASGFTRRTIPRQLLRSIGGSRLRRALGHCDPAARISMLLEALRDIDALARRIARYLTRLAPIIAVQPPQDAARTLAAFAPRAADSS
jgi:hypothetical protein